ncbi:transmembrane protein [Planoprotostelium fungivorum]|uniref:Transmembrane protein 107 n=1 Tax=Planoprotostelium fungivorum TaxID=1890364 RepID=A0A2P6MVR6_9EUKA|nr:transmembrane protein [Planoprotostelium fungivorum]
MNIHDLLLPSRFLMSLGHIILLFMIAQTLVQDYQNNNDQSASQFILQHKSIGSAVGLSIVGIFVQLGSFLGGFTMFHSLLSFVHIIVDFIAVILLSFYVTDNWPQNALWWIFGTLNAPFALLEMGSTIAQTVAIKKSKYKL